MADLQDIQTECINLLFQLEFNRRKELPGTAEMPLPCAEFQRAF